MCEQAVERTSAVQNRSLMASGIPSSTPALPAAMRASEALAISAARSGVSSTNALSERAFSIAEMCAVTNSPAEKDFFFSPSRASAKLSDVNSVTVSAHPPFVVQVPSALIHPLRHSAHTQKPSHRVSLFSSRRRVPLRGRQPSPNIQVRRRCTLLDHLWHQEEIILAHRSIF